MDVFICCIRYIFFKICKTFNFHCATWTSNLVHILFFRQYFCLNISLFTTAILDWIFYICNLQYSTLLHLPPLRFHCAGGCWDWTQECCDFGIGSQTLTTRLDLVHVYLYPVAWRVFLNTVDIHYTFILVEIRDKRYIFIPNQLAAVHCIRDIW